MSIYHIRVEAKTDMSYRMLTVDLRGPTWSCDCSTFEIDRFCSHVDAALVVGAREMVHASDHWAADRCTEALKNIITVPDTWKRSWQRRPQWRRPEYRPDAPTRAAPIKQDMTKPAVCFTGQFDQSRSQMADEAQANGWVVFSSAAAGVSVLVTSDLKSSSNKIKAARQKGIRIVDYSQWQTIMITGEI